MGILSGLFKGIARGVIHGASSTSEDNDPYSKYTHKWLHGSSESELNEERERIRLRHCSGDERAMTYLDMIDREKRRRYDEEHPDEEPGFPAHREHGWYLSNDD